MANIGEEVRTVEIPEEEPMEWPSFEEERAEAETPEREEVPA